MNNRSGLTPRGSRTRSTPPLVSKQKWHMTVRNELHKCGSFWQHLWLAERQAAQRQELWFPVQKPFTPQQTCANAAGRAPLAFGPHQRLILLGHVRALLMCLFLPTLFGFNGKNDGEKQAINSPVNEPGLPLCSEAYACNYSFQCAKRTSYSGATASQET